MRRPMAEENQNKENQNQRIDYRTVLVVFNAEDTNPRFFH